MKSPKSHEKLQMPHAYELLVGFGLHHFLKVSSLCYQDSEPKKVFLDSGKRPTSGTSLPLTVLWYIFSLLKKVMSQLVALGLA